MGGWSIGAIIFNFIFLFIADGPGAGTVYSALLMLSVYICLFLAVLFQFGTLIYFSYYHVTDRNGIELCN